MCICVYVYMCICVYVYMCICVYVYEDVSENVYVYMLSVCACYKTNTNCDTTQIHIKVYEIQTNKQRDRKRQLCSRKWVNASIPQKVFKLLLNDCLCFLIHFQL